MMDTSTDDTAKYKTGDYVKVTVPVMGTTAIHLIYIGKIVEGFQNVQEMAPRYYAVQVLKVLYGQEPLLQAYTESEDVLTPVESEHVSSLLAL